MSYIGAEPSNNFVSLKRQVITGNGGTSYTLDHSVASVNDVAIFVNNVRQDPASYSISGTALTLGGTISSSDSCYVIFLGQALQTVTPDANTITNAMLGETITVAKGGTGVTTSADLANTGNLVLIKTKTLSSASTPIQFLNSETDVTFDSTYQIYKFIANVKYENDNRVTYVRVSTDGTNLDTTSGNYLYDRISTKNATVTAANDAASSVFQLENAGTGNATGEYMSFELTLFNNTTLNYPRFICNLFNRRTNGESELVVRSGRYIVNSPLQGISFFPNSSNNYDTGSTISMYGVKT